MDNPQKTYRVRNRLNQPLVVDPFVSPALHFGPQEVKRGITLEVLNSLQIRANIKAGNIIVLD